MKKGFTLIELLAVIVILAIIALIATPIVLNIIEDSRKSSGLRSAEMYLDAVEEAISIEKMDNTNFNPSICTVIEEGNLNCEGYDKNPIEVEVNGEVPESGSTITFGNGRIKEVNLNYLNKKTIVINSDDKLDYIQSTSDELDMSTIDDTLSNNSWETIQKVVQAGKVSEAGWSVGDTKTLNIYNDSNNDGTWENSIMLATLIDIDHDGENTATFMIMGDPNPLDGVSRGIGNRSMNPDNYQYVEDEENIGRWEDSEMRRWLNGEVYNSMTDVKNYIKNSLKSTNAGIMGNPMYNNGNSTRGHFDKIFLLSPSETGLEVSDDYVNSDIINIEGSVYDWFKNNSLQTFFWLRSPVVDSNYNTFFGYTFGGQLMTCDESDEIPVFPAFVIG